jgi:tetratricopeptide (TPR) repeat protein
LQREVAVCHLNIGRLLHLRGDLEAAARSFATTLEIATAANAVAPRDARFPTLLVSGDRELGAVRRHQGDGEAALICVRRAVQRLEAALAAHPDDGMADRQLAAARLVLARLRKDEGDHAGALDLYRRVVAAHEADRAAEPESARHSRNLAVAHCEMGFLFGDMERWNDALRSAQRASALTETLAAADPEDADARQILLFEDMLLCRVLARTSKRVSPQCQKAVDRAESLVHGSDSRRAQVDLMKAWAVFGRARQATGDGKGALVAFQHELDVAAPLLSGPSADPWAQALAARAHIEAASVWRERARRAGAREQRPFWIEARRAYQRGLELADALQERRPNGETLDRDRVRQDLTESEAALAAAPIS